MILHIIIDQNNIDYNHENTQFKLTKSHYLKGCQGLTIYLFSFLAPSEPKLDTNTLQCSIKNLGKAKNLITVIV